MHTLVAMGNSHKEVEKGRQRGFKWGNLDKDSTSHFELQQVACGGQNRRREGVGLELGDRHVRVQEV